MRLERHSVRMLKSCLSKQAYESLLAERARQLIARRFAERVGSRAKELLSRDERSLVLRVLRRMQAAGFFQTEEISSEEILLTLEEAQACRKLLFDREVERAFADLQGALHLRALQEAIQQTLAEAESRVEGSISL